MNKSRTENSIPVPYAYIGPVATRHQAHIYVVEFHTGGIKVGMTTQPDIRIGNHVRNGRAFARPVIDVWMSVPHLEAEENERRLMRHCAGGPVGGRGRARDEYFDYDFGTAVRFAQGLTMTPGGEVPPTSLGRVVARNVSAERSRRGWSQAQLSREMGWSKSTMSDVETGQRTLTVDDLVPLCRCLRVPLARLLEFADPQDCVDLGL